jgi:hypothetical protein
MLCAKCARTVTSLTVLGSSYRVEGKHIVPTPGLGRAIQTNKHDEVALAVLLAMQRFGTESTEAGEAGEAGEAAQPPAPLAPNGQQALAQLILTLPMGLIGPALISKKRKLQVEANLRILLTTRHSAIVSDPECVILCDRLRRQKESIVLVRAT